MQIFIPSYNRPNTISTHLIFEKAGVDYRIVLHDEAQRVAYLSNSAIDPQRLLVTNAPRGLTNQRKWIMESQEEGAWYASLDDNIQCFKNRERFISTPELMAEFEKCIIQADKIGAHLIGFATTDNLYFRKKTWKYPAFVIGKAMLIKRGKAQHNPLYNNKEDYQFTAENLLKYGVTLRNDDLYPVAKHFTAGGMGTKFERMPDMIRGSRLLLTDYPGLYRINSKRGFESEVLMRLHTKQQIDQWRFQMALRGKKNL